MFDREPNDDELEDDLEDAPEIDEDDLDDEEDLEKLEDHLDEDEESDKEELQDEDALEDDPWEKQVRMNKNKGSRKDNLW